MQAYVRTYTPTRINTIRRQQKCSKREAKEEKSFFPFFSAKHADSSAWLLPQSEIIFLARCCVRNLRCSRSTRRSIHVFHSLFAPPQQKWNLYSKTRTQSGGGGNIPPRVSSTVNYTKGFSWPFETPPWIFYEFWGNDKNIIFEPLLPHVLTIGWRVRLLTCRGESSVNNTQGEDEVTGSYLV